MRNDNDTAAFYAVSSEAGVIATLIHNPNFYYYCEQLMPNHFSNIENGCIYAAIMTLVNGGIENVDAYNIHEILESEATRKLADGITLEKIQELIEMSDEITRHTPEEYKMLANNILTAALRREVYKKLKKCESMCKEEDIEDLGRQVYDEIDSTIREYTVTEEIPEFKEVVDSLWNDIKAHQNGGCGVPFWMPALNEYVTLEPGELVVVAAPPKGGKSMFTLCAAVEAMKRNETVMYIDSELSDRLFLMRMICHISKVEFKRIKYGTYDEEEAKRIDEAREWIKSKNIVHYYMPIFSADEVYMAVKKVYNKYNGLGLLIVDYFKSNSDTDAYATYAELGKLSDICKNDLCGALKIPGLAAAQLTSTNKLADSAKIARNASTVILLQDKAENEVSEEYPDEGNKKLFVQFNRNGAQMSQGEWIDCEFNGDLASWEQASRQHTPQLPY